MVQTGESAALKLAKKASPKIAERLEHEARVQGRVQHSNVVRVLRSVQIDGMPGILMGLVEGPSLAMLLQRRSFTLPEALALGEILIRAVDAIHRAGVIHRDLKPSNVLVHLNTGIAEPFITDFGLACLLADDDFDAIRSGVLYGTPGYMSPERLINPQNAEARSDVFALGAILYHLVCGKPAFPADSDSIFANIAEGRFERPARALDLSPAVEVAIVGCLLPNVSQRIPDCKTLLALWTGSGGAPYSLPAGFLKSLDDQAGVYRSELTIIPSEEDLISGDRIMPVPQNAPLVRRMELPPALRTQVPVAAPTVVDERVRERSAGRERTPPPAQGAPPAEERRSRAPLVLVAVILLGLAVAWALSSSRAPSEPVRADLVIAVKPEVQPAVVIAPAPVVEPIPLAVSHPAAVEEAVPAETPEERLPAASAGPTTAQTPTPRPSTPPAAPKATSERPPPATPKAPVETPVVASAAGAAPVVEAPVVEAKVAAAPAAVARVEPSTPAATPAAVVAKSATPTATLTDLDVVVGPTAVTLRGQLEGGAHPLGMLMDDGTGCEYRIKLASTHSEVGMSRLPVVSSLVKQITVSESNGSVLVRAQCGTSTFKPNFSTSPDGFVLVLSQK